MALTNLQIMESALEFAQLDNSSTFLSLCRKYMNTILLKEAQEVDWQWYRKKTAATTFTGGTVAYTLPDDYLRSDNCYFAKVSTGARGSKINVVDPWSFDQFAGTNTSGYPTMCFIDTNLGKLTFNSMQSSVSDAGYILSYFRKPTEIALGGGDDALAADFKGDDYLIKRITQYLYKYQDDVRYPDQRSEADMAKRDLRLNANDYNDNSKINLGNNFKAGSRPTRGNSGGWFSGGN